MITGQVASPKPAVKIDPALYLIAVCDVLGFSNLIRTRTLAEVYDRYVKLRTQIENVAPLTGFAPRVEQPFVVQDAVVFSDTVLLWAPANGAMEVLAMNLCPLIGHALKVGLPLRVGVALGECVIDPANDIFIGEPIVDAYETEKRQDWMGGAYHPSCWGPPGFLERLCRWHWAVKYPVPVKTLKAGEQVGPPLEYAVGWPLFAGLFFAGQDVLQAFDDHEGGATDNKAKGKWQNARAFYTANRG